MAKLRITQTTPYDSAMTPVFWCKNHGKLPTRSPHWGSVQYIIDFSLLALGLTRWPKLTKLDGDLQHLGASLLFCKISARSRKRSTRCALPKFLTVLALGLTRGPKFTQKGDDLLSTQVHHPAKFHRPVSINQVNPLGIETRVLKNPGPGETRPFCQTRNAGLKAAETRVSGLCFSAAFCTFEQQIVQQFNAFFTIVHKQSKCLFLLFLQSMDPTQ